MPLIATQDEGPPIRFSSPSSALAWADEVLTKDGVRDHIGKLQKVAGDIPMQELQDWALTISGTLAAIRPWHYGSLYRFVYGDSMATHPDEIARELVPEIGKRCAQASRRKTHRQLQNFAVAMMGAAREDLGRGRRMPVAQLAYMLGLKRQTLQNPTWVTLRKETQALLYEVLDWADKCMAERLADKGVLDG